MAIDFIWQGGTANWSANTGANWDQAAGLRVLTDNVFIDNGNTGVNSVVSVNIDTTINNLTIDLGDSLDVNRRLLSFAVLGNVVNNGNLSMNSVGKYHRA